MPQFYRVLKADPLGEPWTNPNVVGAKPTQKFWCQVEGVDEPVMIGKQVPNTPSLTEGHYGVLEDATSSKGNAYKKFTSMQIPQGTSKPQYAGVTEPQPAGTAQVDDTIVPTWFHPYARVLKEVAEYVREQRGEAAIVNPAPEEPDTATEEHKEEPMAGTTLTKAELDDMFGGEVTPLDIE